MPKKTKLQLEAENTALRRFRVAEGFVSVVNTLIKWGAIAFIAWCIHLSIAELSGKQTNADIKINADIKANVNNDKKASMLANLNLEWVPWFSLGTLGVIYGLRQRHLRKSTVELLYKRLKDHELEVDPNRSSSKLTVRGNTRPEDR